MPRALFEPTRRLALRTIYRLGYRVMPLVWRLTRPNVEGAMVAVRCKDRILFVRNSYRPEWTLPGGGVEPHEAPIEAAVRELREEIGWLVEAWGWRSSTTSSPGTTGRSVSRSIPVLARASSSTCPVPSDAPRAQPVGPCDRAVRPKTSLLIR